MPAAFAERMPLCESSTAAQRSRRDAEPPCRLEVDVRRRLAARDLLGGDGRLEAAPRARRRSSTVSMSGAVRRRRDRERVVRREPRAPRRPRRQRAAAAPGTRASMRRTTSSLIASGSSATPAVSCRYRDHSGELMPIIARWISSS